MDSLIRRGSPSHLIRGSLRSRLFHELATLIGTAFYGELRCLTHGLGILPTRRAAAGTAHAGILTVDRRAARQTSVQRPVRLQPFSHQIDERANLG
jgi:hypothetical protein